MTRLARNPVALWSAFILAHLWLGLLNLYADGLPLGDVTIVYKFWSDQVILADFWVGIHSSWVYPILAIFPMLAAAVFGPGLYASTWLSLVMLLDAVGFAMITGFGRESRNAVAAWWWIGFLLLLGPIALGRIDSITVPLAIAGVMVVATRPRAAAVLLTVAAWVKVWPAALVAAVVVVSRERWRVVGAAAMVSALVLAVALAFGSGLNVFSFVTQQTGRGLQVESPVSTIWMWEAFAGVPGSAVYYDQAILTWQVAGPGADVAGAVMTPLLGLVVVALVLVGILSFRRGARPETLLPPLALALVTALLVFNKVGSPQFVTWLAVPVVLGLVASRGSGSPADRAGGFVVPAVLVAAIAALTQSFYPYLYGWLLGLHPVLLIALTAKNLLLCVLLGWAVRAIWTAADRSAPDEAEDIRLPARNPLAGPSAWPL
jgi:hypothetical protein